MKEIIRNKAKELGIERVGFSKNAVVALLPYFVEGEDGNLSMYARGKDYHIVLEEKLERLSLTLKELGAKETKIHVDKGNYNDRKAAYEASLGFYGMNGMLLAPGYGSYFFIGQIIHDLELEEDTPQDRECLMCGRCQRECPANAINGDGIDVERCLSHITQKRGELSDEEKKLIKRQKTCWGCDVCQRVCPHNRGLKTTASLEFLENRITSLKKEDIEGLSNKEFKEKYGNYAFSWRGKTVLLRNLELLAEDETYEEE